MLKDKAIENLAAAELLLARGHVNAAASRYYYAMYEAAVWALTKKGKLPGAFRSGAVEWDHSMVENNAGMLRSSFEDRLLYGAMRAARVTADYHADCVNALELRRSRAAVAEFVKELAA
jgi:uncharacterized protein (UPF0332 family)